MAAKEDDSLSLDGSISFDDTENGDGQPIATARSFMYNARTPISLTGTQSNCDAGEGNLILTDSTI